MFIAAAAGAGQPAVAALLGLGTAGLAGAVVAMAWNVHVRQIRLAEQLARRQFLVIAQPPAAGPANGRGGPAAAHEEGERVNGTASASAVVIEGPDTVVVGEQARYRVRPSGNRKVVSWAVGGGSVSQAPDPAHSDELLLIADRPGNLTIMVRAREGMAERRGTRAITAVAEVPDPAPPFTLRLFLHGWGLVAVAILIAGFSGALVALGSLPSSDFIALVTPLAAVLGVVAIAARGAGDGGGTRGRGRGAPSAWFADPPAPARPHAGEAAAPSPPVAGRQGPG
jgi:hypothetical protein